MGRSPCCAHGAGKPWLADVSQDVVREAKLVGDEWGANGSLTLNPCRERPVALAYALTHGLSQCGHVATGDFRQVRC
jgi:hypothetical protein